MDNTRERPWTLPLSYVADKYHESPLSATPVSSHESK